MAENIFNIPMEHLQGYSRGEGLSASKENRRNKVIDALRGGVPLARQVDTPVVPAAAAGAAIAWFKYHAYNSNTDTFRAYPWDWSTNSVSVEGGEIPANLVHIAYPIELRRSYYHNKTVAVSGINYKLVGTGTLIRTSTEIGNTENVETQIVIPRYSGAVDVLIAAIKGETGTFDAYSGGEPVMWQDLNLGARAWAKTSD